MTVSTGELVKMIFQNTQKINWESSFFHFSHHWITLIFSASFSARSLLQQEEEEDEQFQTCAWLFHYDLVS